MSFSDPTKSVSSPANMFLKLDSRSETNLMFLHYRRKEGDSEQRKVQVDSFTLIVLDEGFSTVSGRVPGGGYLRCNIIHHTGNTVLKVSEEKEGGNGIKREIATGNWKTIKDVVSRNGGRSTKHVYGLLLKADGPESEDLNTLNAELAKNETIIKIDIKGKWWGLYLDFTKRVKINNLDQMYIQFTLPLRPYQHSFGIAWLPSIVGRKVDPEKDAELFDRCKLLDSTVIKEYRGYIAGKTVRDEPVPEATVEDFAAATGANFDPTHEPSEERAAEIHKENAPAGDGAQPVSPDDNLPF